MTWLLLSLTAKTTNTDPDSSSKQGFEVVKLGRIHGSESNSQLMVTKDLLPLIQATHVAQHQAKLLVEVFSDERANKRKSLDPGSKRLRFLLSHEAGFKMNQEDLLYTDAQQQRHLEETIGTDTENYEFIQGEAQIILTQSNEIGKSLEHVLDLIGHIPLKTTTPKRFNVQPTIEQLKDHLYTLNLGTLLTENSGSKKLLRAEILDHLNKFFPEIPDSETADKQAAQGLSLQNTAQKILFAASKGYSLSSLNDWGGSGVTARTKHQTVTRTCPNHRNKRQLAVAVLAGAVGLFGSTLLANYQGSADHAQLMCLLKDQNTLTESQRQLAAKVEDSIGLQEVFSERQDQIYKVILRLGKRIYSNLARVHFLELSTLLTQTINLLRDQLKAVKNSVERIAMNQFPHELISLRDLKTGVVSALTKAKKSGHVLISEDLRILNQAMITVIHLDLKLTILVHLPLKNHLFGLPELYFVKENQEIFEQGIAYKLNLKNSLFAIFRKQNLVLELPSDTLQACSLFSEQVKIKTEINENFGQGGQENRIYVCTRDHPLRKLDFNVYEVQRDHCIFSLLKKDIKKSLKTCNVTMSPLNKEVISQKERNHFVSRDVRTRKRYQRCFDYTESGKLMVYNKAVYASHENHIRLMPKCFYMSKNFVILPQFHEITKVANSKSSIFTEFHPFNLFKIIQNMQSSDFKTRKSLIDTMNNFTQLMNKNDPSMELSRLKNLKDKLKELENLKLRHPLKTTGFLIAHVAVTITISAILITALFYLYKKRGFAAFIIVADKCRKGLEKLARSCRKTPPVEHDAEGEREAMRVEYLSDSAEEATNWEIVRLRARLTKVEADIQELQKTQQQS